VKKRLFIGLLLCLARPADAACTVTGGNISFGSYDGSTAVAGLGLVSFNCGSLTSFTVKLGSGSGTIAQRTLQLNGTGPATLSYNLYTDLGHTHIWGDGITGDTQGVLSVLGGSSLSLFGLVPSGQKVTAGSFSDNVVITIVF
jgi:spore coat protein U-like protein